MTSDTGPTDTAAARARVSPILRVPPPALFALAFLAGYGIERLWPLGRHLRDFVPITNGLGFALLGCGVLLAATAMAVFIRARTTIIPHGRPGRLVSAGPYRFTRNPMYVSLVLVYLALASLMQLLWPLPMLPLAVLAVHRFVIPFEEASLEAAFGADYAAYRRKVRRWL